MPYKSDAQRRWAHTASGMKALGPSKVDEFDKASKGKKLPERTNPTKKSVNDDHHYEHKGSSVHRCVDKIHE